MLYSYEFEYDLAAHRVYELKQDLWKYEDDEAEEVPEEIMDYRKSKRLLNQIRDRRETLRRLEIDMRQYDFNSVRYRNLKERFDEVKAEILLRCSKISFYWEKTIGVGYEDKERARLKLKRKGF